MLTKTREGFQEQIQRYIDLMKKIGMPVTEEKTLGPTQFLEYLSLLLNLIDLTLQIPENKRWKNIEKIDLLLEKHRGRKNVTVKEILKVAGSFNFICAAIPVGKVFITDLYKLTRSPDGAKVKQSHHRRIPKSVAEDLKIFRIFLEECSQDRYRSIPFLIKQKVFNEELQLFADSAGARALGFGCVFGNRWAYGSW